MTKIITLLGSCKYDKLIIEIKRKNIVFHIYCDGTGFSTSCIKEQLQKEIGGNEK